jgi:nitrite reductase/ring-hydroxylating ferredoxin subunit
MRHGKIGHLMSEFAQLGKTSDLAEGTMKEIMADGRSLLIARIGETYYAADNKCPHFGAKLSEGALEGTVVICPKHKSRFNLSDGHVVQWTDLPRPVAVLGTVFKRPRALKMYKVKVEGDSILAEL